MDDAKKTSLEADDTSDADDPAVDSLAAGEIARHWHEAGNWLRLEAMLTDRALVAAVWRHCSDEEILQWWEAIESATGWRMEERYEAAWRRWDLGEDSEESRLETRCLANTVAAILVHAGRVGDFPERLLRTAMRLDAAEDGEGSTLVGIRLMMLARLLRLRGDHETAAACLERAVAIAERMEGPDSWEVALRTNLLADEYLGQGAFREAVRLYRRALAIAERAVGTHSPDLLFLLEDLVSGLCGAGEADAAVPYSRRVVEIAEGRAEPSPSAVGRALRGFASVLERAGAFAEALPHRLRAQAIADAELGPLHWVSMNHACELAETLVVLDRAAEGEQLLRRLLSIAERSAGNEDGSLSYALLCLGRFLFQRERYEEAVPVFERVLAVFAEHGGEAADPESHAVVLLDLALAHRESGRLEEAAACLDRAAGYAERMEPRDPLLVARVRSALGQVRMLEQRCEEAGRLFEACLAIRRELLPPGHPDIARVEEKLARAREGLAPSAQGNG